MKASFAKFKVTIIGSISGVNPTATAKLYVKAFNQPLWLLFCAPMMIKIVIDSAIIVHIIIQLTLRIPLSKAVFSLFLVKAFAIEPKYVSLPVDSTTPIAVPEDTEVPIKHKFEHSRADVTLLAINVLSFSTGSDSPVSDDWVINKSFADIILISAGIISPAAKLIISPGKISSIEISLKIPFLLTAIVVLIICFNFSLALLDLPSWKKRIKPDIKIIAVIIPNEIQSEISIFSADATGTKILKQAIIERIIQKGFEKALKSNIHQVSCFLVEIALYPYFSLRSSISLIFKPSVVVFNDCKHSFSLFLACSIKNWFLFNVKGDFCLILLFLMLLVFTICLLILSIRKEKN